MPMRKPAAQKPPAKDAATKPVKAKEKTPKVKAAPEPVKEQPKPQKPVTAEAVTPKPAKPPAAARKPKTRKITEQEPVPAIAELETPAAARPVVDSMQPVPEPPGAVQSAPAVQGGAGFDAKAQVVLEAINQGSALEFIFEDGDANPPRTFEPRTLLYDALTMAWYAWGWDRRYNAERHHRLELLKEINPVEGLGRAAQGPFKEGTPANLIGGWLGGEPIPVKAVLLKQWLFAVKQAPPPFPAFQMEDIEDGKAQVTFTATDLRAIARWCMQFGDGIQVLEPQRLVDRIKQVGITWGGKPRETEAPRPLAPPVQLPPRQAAAPAPPPRREPREPEEKPKGKAPRVEVRTERL